MTRTPRDGGPKGPPDAAAKTVAVAEDAIRTLAIRHAISGRGFMAIAGLCGLTLAGAAAEPATGAAAHGWIRTARVFLIDAYQPPMAPRLEYDAEELARTMAEMHANTVRIGTMGKYAMIPGIRFTRHPDLGNRDILAETIAAAKPRSIRVVPYISTGHKLAWSMVTRDFPEYAQRTRPGGGPARSHMFVGEDHGTVCWNTPYRAAYLEYVEKVVRDYDIDALYFDTWRPAYFWPGLKLCYCEGCRAGFRQATGREIPWRENEAAYTAAERSTIAAYQEWNHEQVVAIAQQVRRLVKRHKDIPLIYNINNPGLIAREDPRILATMDAFLYERGDSLLERAEGVSLARAAGLGVWPYVGVYHGWPRLVSNRLDYQQEIFAAAAFGGAPIVAQPTGYVMHAENRRWVADPFSVLAGHEDAFLGFENVPYAAVIHSRRDPPGRQNSGRYWPADARSATRGAFAACLHGHVQVSSALPTLLDDPQKLARYRVVHLADVIHLTASQVANLRRYVGDGGGVVASYGTGLYDEAGRRLERFALENLLRVRPVRPQDELAESLANYQSMMGGPNDLYLASRSMPERTLLPLWFFEPVEPLPGGEITFDIVTGDGRRAILPGVVTSRHGRGRVVYLSSSLESLYSSTTQADLGGFLRDLVTWAAGRPPPVKLNAPPALIVNLTRNGNREVLHLLNWSTDTRNEAGYLPPVENVAIEWAVPEGRRVRQVSTLLETSIRFEMSGRTLKLTLPRLDAYQGIAVEFD